MRLYTHAETADVASATLYRAMSDIRQWPVWDHAVECTTHDGALTPGTRFGLKPKGGPRLSLEIVEATAPSRFVVVARLPLGRLRMHHLFLPDPSGQTEVVTRIEVYGPLAFLWDRLVARGLAAGMAEQSRCFIAYAAQSNGLRRGLPNHLP